MQPKIVNWVFFSFLFLGAYGCKSAAPPEGQTGNAPVPSTLSVEAWKVSAGKFMDLVEVVGSLSPKHEAYVKAEFQAVVTQVYVKEWLAVRKGDPLAKLDTSEMEILRDKMHTQVEMSKAVLLKAEVGLNRANREYERLLKLKEVGLVTQQNLDDAKTQKEAAEADIVAAQSQIKAAEGDVHQVEIRLGKAILRAPMDGMVAECRPNMGDLVGDPTSSTPLFRIVDNRLLNLDLEVPSIRLGAIKTGQPIQFNTESIPGKTFSGKVSFIKPTADSASRSVQVQAEVPNQNQELRPGLFVKGQILTGQSSQNLQVPKTALVVWDVAANQGAVFRIDGDVAKRQKVQTGRTEGDWVEIVSGLEDGQLVITRGAFTVHDGDRIKVNKQNGV
jgi:RND family efflux transporter MFP subunit